ncbi:alkaline phosphatase D family protein, partial [uncultured Idiomarina sp.]
LYRTDEGLQALHAHAPFIAVWDDHEISNDTWKNGAENHQEDEGSFIERRAAAVQAYYEWLPIRPPQGEANLTIYRDFKFGDLVDLIMLDTRVIGRDKQLNYDDYRDAESGQFNTQKFQQDMSSDRSIMGKKQLQWLVNKLNNSSARWQVLGQQLLMGKMNFPSAAFAADDRSKVTPLLLQIAELKKRLQNGEELTPQQQAMVTQVTPYNLDAWDGYPIEREMLYRAAKKANKQLVVIAGDTHNAWHSELRSSDGAHIGVEFATSSVSSPGMEAYLSLDTKTAEQLAKALPTLIEDLKYTNLHQRGYMNLFASEDAVEAEWVFVDTIRSKDYRVVNKHRARYTGS